MFYILSSWRLRRELVATCLHTGHEEVWNTKARSEIQTNGREISGEWKDQIQLGDISIDVLTAVTAQILAFWVLTPVAIRVDVGGDERSGEMYSPIFRLSWEYKQVTRKGVTRNNMIRRKGSSFSRSWNTYPHTANGRKTFFPRIRWLVASETTLLYRNLDRNIRLLYSQYLSAGPWQGPSFLIIPFPTCDDHIVAPKITALLFPVPTFPDRLIFPFSFQWIWFISCRLPKSNRFLIVHISTPRVKSMCYSETSATTYNTTSCRYPQDNNL